MLFNSLQYAVFLPIVLALYFAAGRRGYRLQNQLLVVASYLFYGWWDYRFLFLIVASTVVDFNTALLVDGAGPTPAQRRRSALLLVSAALLFATPDWFALSSGAELGTVLPDTLWGWSPLGAALAWTLISEFWFPALLRLEAARRRRIALTMSITINLGILGFFKYFDWFAASLSTAVESALGIQLSPLTLGLILPVGISFYTLQTISYSVDVYRGELRASTSLVDFAAYVAFFPQLVAGPIERGRHLIPQFQRPRTTSWEDVRQGSWLIGWGLFKKIAIADPISRIVGQSFGPYDQLTVLAAPEDGVRILVAVYAFAIQIYADFSGYSDIARGSARLLGFDIMLNFRLPYFSVDPSSFWDRWHISLSTWLRDYLYIPLGGNRSGRARTYSNLLVTMLVGGVWHGAAWTFVIWGAFPGIVVAVYRALRVPRGAAQLSWPRSVLQGLLMFHLVCFGWLLFRAQNLETVGFFVQALARDFHWTAQAGHDFYVLGLIAWPLLVIQACQWWSGRLDVVLTWPKLAQAYVWAFLVLGIVAHSNNTTAEFIYFAF
ncbi:MAG: MBOAT family O-acyltransferase [Myxococcota bacterium]|nr:MBOAT family O-acyltransferase [Myxococcota bacterium]